jgi:glycogen synthase
MAEAVKDAIKAFQNNAFIAVKNRQHAESFSWQATAQQYADIYRSVLKRI